MCSGRTELTRSSTQNRAIGRTVSSDSPKRAAKPRLGRALALAWITVTLGVTLGVSVTVGVTVAARARAGHFRPPTNYRATGRSTTTR